MAGRFELYNSALTFAGTSILAREDETTAQGNACRALFNQQYEMTLSEVPWNFAYRNSALVAVTEEQAPAGVDHRYLYHRPPGYIRLWWRDPEPVAGRRPVTRPPDLLEQGLYLRGSRDGQCCEHIFRAPLSAAPPRFIHVLELRLAHALSYRFPKPGKTQELRNLLTTTREEAYIIERAAQREQQQDQVEQGRDFAYYGGGYYDTDRQYGGFYP